jgi:hypothetical protein
MKYLFYLTAFGLSIGHSQAQDSESRKIPSIKIRKKIEKLPFRKALSLPRTATSCDCPTGSNRNSLIKLGCQHPDTAAVCKVVVTQFDVAIIPERGETIILKKVEGSFLDGRALAAMNTRYGEGVFVSYTNIKGMTTDGKKIVVPSFGTENPEKRAKRDYVAIYNYLINIGNTKVYSFELSAYNRSNQMVFRQTYNKDTFDKNAMRPDANRYTFKDIKATHTSGFEVEIDDFEIEDINISIVELLSSRN